MVSLRMTRTWNRESSYSVPRKCSRPLLPLPDPSTSQLITVDELVYDVAVSEKWGPSAYGSLSYAEPSALPDADSPADSPVYDHPLDHRGRIARSESLMRVPLGLTRSRTALFELMAKTLRESTSTFRLRKEHPDDAMPIMSSLCSTFTRPASSAQLSSAATLNGPPSGSTFNVLVSSNASSNASSCRFSSDGTQSRKRHPSSSPSSSPEQLVSPSPSDCLIGDTKTKMGDWGRWTCDPALAHKTNAFRQCHPPYVDDSGRPSVVFRQPLVHGSMEASTNLKFSSGRLSWLRLLKHTFNAITRCRDNRPPSGTSLFTDELLSCTDLDMFCKYRPPEWKLPDANSLLGIEESLSMLETKARRCTTQQRLRAIDNATNPLNVNTSRSRRTYNSAGCSCSFTTWGYASHSSCCSCSSTLEGSQQVGFSYSVDVR